MSEGSWTVAEAKARFSEVLEQAQSKGPQIITRHGKKTAVVVASREWDRRKIRVGTLADFFANSPLRGSGLKIGRIKGGLRPVDL